MNYPSAPVSYIKTDAFFLAGSGYVRNIPVRLAHFIVANSEAILPDREKFAATLVAEGNKNARALLRDHVKTVIETIAIIKFLIWNLFPLKHIAPLPKVRMDF